MSCGTVAKKSFADEAGLATGLHLGLVLVIQHHHGVLIVVVNLEAQHADHSPSVFSVLPKPGCQRGFSTASTPAVGARRQERPLTAIVISHWSNE